MEVHFHCGSFYLRYGVEKLIAEHKNVFENKVDNLYILDISKGNSFSLITFIKENLHFLSKSNSRMLVLINERSEDLFIIRGVRFIKSNVSLQDWNKILVSLAFVPEMSILLLQKTCEKFNFNKLTSREKDVVRCLWMKMDLLLIAKNQDISVKTCYAIIYSIRNKLALGSARELYLNIDYIYRGINEDYENFSEQRRIT